tara:strand:- start:916 stop:1158 length:243 start_codon:yes stop_codon:yes gene_type:complete
MILYREKDLDRAYKIDCRCRTKNNSPWIKREEFRTIYEDLMELYMLGLDNELLEEDDAPEFIVDSLESILTKSLHFEPEK